MLLTLVLLFTVLPIVEISLLVTIGGAIGWPATLLIALGTGMLGATLARQQGLTTIARIGAQLQSGKPPGDALLDGALILFAAAVLITPGVLTDAVGFALLAPPFRQILKPLLLSTLKKSVRVQASSGGKTWVWSSDPIPNPPSAKHSDGVIDAEYTEVRSRDAD